MKKATQKDHFYRTTPQLSFNFEKGLLLDYFCGGGGASEAMELAFGRPVDIAINHDLDSIRMHTVNHSSTRHYQEDVFKFNPIKECGGRPVLYAHLSPDCTHHSKARGGKPKSKKIRGLAWVAIRLAKMPKHLRPAMISVENVEEFTSWGPLDEDGQPIKARAGETFREWVRKFKKYGYTVDWRELRACDYGAPTIRKRLFVIARCDGLPITWPAPTHGPGTGQPYKTAADIIDWTIPCKSIFGRKKPLADATLRRIARGLQKFVIDNPDPFIAPIKSQNVSFISTYYGNKAAEGDARGCTMKDPVGTVTSGGNRHALVTAFLAKHFGGNYTGAGIPMEKPTATITTRDHHALVTAQLEPQQAQVQPEPHKTIVTSHLIRHFGESIGSEVDSPTPTVMATGMGKTGLVTSHLVKLRGTCQHGQPVTEPCPTITAGGLHVGEVRAFIIKHNTRDTGHDARDPLHTVTGKSKLGIVMVKGEPYKIVDIQMRMLEPRELFRAQGFEDDYVIEHDGHGKRFTKESQVARCGNSVAPPVLEAIIRANLVEQQALVVAA